MFVAFHFIQFRFGVLLLSSLVTDSYFAKPGKMLAMSKTAYLNISSKRIPRTLGIPW